MSSTKPAVPASAAPADFEIMLPEFGHHLDQDEEWCDVVMEGERRRVRFHDYHEIYGIPGLYERLFCDLLQCQSPQVIRHLLAQVLAERGTEPGELRVLDVGAGNGMVGEELRELGGGAIFGVDIIDEAAAAAQRDRPGVYDHYFVADLTDLTSDQREFLVRADLNTMTTVAALGFGDIPPSAFAAAYNLISAPGLVAFTIKENFVTECDLSGFGGLIRRMLDGGIIRFLAERRYRHRLSVREEPLYYLAFVGEKVSDIPQSWLGDPRGTSPVMREPAIGE
ncbi:MAG TPA: methyltransferase [Pseudonocardiaceae bacterium]|nr:methyltransferase [Pseudonocardiaceae bacterium]